MTNRLPQRATLLRALLLAAAVAAIPRALEAQRPSTSADPQFEVRGDGVLSPRAGALAGAGLNLRAGYYARIGISALAGAVRVRDAWAGSQRVEGTARFLFDPFAEKPHGFYAGAGLGAVRVADGAVQGLLLGVVGIEGRSEGRVVPALELTVGGGARLAVVLRGRRAQGR